MHSEDTTVLFTFSNFKIILTVWSQLCINDLPVWDTSRLPQAHREQTVAPQDGCPLPHLYTDWCYWAPWPSRMDGLSPHGSQMRSSCCSGCRTATAWHKTAQPVQGRRVKKGIIFAFSSHFIACYIMSIICEAAESCASVEHAEFLTEDTRTSHIIIHLLHCNWACTLVARPTRMRRASVFVASLTFVVGPSSFSATQLCRLNARSLQFTRTRLPNFSSNCFTSGSIPEKSSLWGEHNGRNHIRKSCECWKQRSWTMFYSHHLCVRVQGEQLQPGLTPHPGLNISGALMRTRWTI